ncbi:hypothetical protein [Aliifodinibius sp. S!AR15-10]|nr:hypothetical protein [Aliifodinibius sp. S!AR15-10]
MDEPQEARKYFQQAYSIYLDIFGESSNRTKQAKSYLEQVTQA